MPEPDPTPYPLTPGARKLVEAAAKKQQEASHSQSGVYHWLLALVERHGPMVEGMAQGLDAAAMQRHLYEQLRQGRTGDPLDSEAAVRQAWERAQARGKAQVAERDLAAVILAAAGYSLIEVPGTAPIPATPIEVSAGGNAAVAYRSRVQRPTPALEQYGRDLMREAMEGRLSPLIGRDREIQIVIETLCRRTKRNPVLVGPAGVGKTAIVEGLARRIVRGEAPQPLLGARVLALQPSALAAGARMAGELEKRMKAVLAEASQEGVLLFIDEVHSMVGTGGMAGTGDVASLLKPALARGDLACIAATTDDEYRRFIEPDTALERRFQPIRVTELTGEETLQVLEALGAELERLRKVRVAEEALAHMVDLAGRFLRNRYFPDKAVDILEQCVAHALVQGQATVEMEQVYEVVQRMVGMPLDWEGQLPGLSERLQQAVEIAGEDSEALAHRLQVTIRGLDLHPQRPNASVLVMGLEGDGDGGLARALAAGLFGSEERVVSIDLSSFVHPADVSRLVGAAPGYVGYGESLPLHRLAQMPWCVLLLQNIHACHPQVRDVVVQALAEGFFTDGRGKQLYLSDAVVVITAGFPADTGAPGFRSRESHGASDLRPLVREYLGKDLARAVDLVVQLRPAKEEVSPQWLHNHLLKRFTRRYQGHGVELFWEESAVRWLLSHQDIAKTVQDWERLVEEEVIPHLLPFLAPGGKEKKVMIAWSEGHFDVRDKEESSHGI